MEETLRPFSQVLAELDYGTVHSALTKQLSDLVQRVLETQKQGTLSLTLTVVPAGDNRVEITDEVCAAIEKETGIKPYRGEP